MSEKLKNLIRADQLGRKTMENLFDLSRDIKTNPEKYRNALAGKIVQLMFFEPSTRTRMSFHSAALQLGAGVISTENGNENSSARKGETLEDTIMTLNGYGDAIVMRHSDDDSSERAARVATVPIINAGAGKREHPTQALLDVFTVWERFGSLDGAKIAVLGDLKNGRTTHSLLKLLSNYNAVTVYGLSRKELSMPEEFRGGVDYKICESFDDIPRDVNALYHTRTQRERTDADFGQEPFIIDKKVMQRFSDDTLIMHPLPRNEEISTDVDNDPRAIYFKQAHNGVLTRMALLLTLLGDY